MEQSGNVQAMLFGSSRSVISSYERHACPSKPAKLNLGSVFQVFVGLVIKENNYLTCSSEILGYIKIFDLF